MTSGHGIHLVGLKRCRVKGCTAKRAARGLCSKHDLRHRQGRPVLDTLTPEQRRLRESLGLKSGVR